MDPAREPDALGEDAAPILGVGSVEVAPGVVVDAGLLRFTYSRASGPGGQNVNKRSTKATLRVAVDGLPVRPGVRRRLVAAAGDVGARVTVEGDLLIVADEHRSQRQNRDECLERLRILLVRATPEPKIRRPTKPTRSSQRRRMDEKTRRGDVKRSRRSGREGGGGGGDA